MKVIIHTNILKNIGLGLLLTINYVIEGFILYILIEGITTLSKYWGVAIFALILLVVRLGITYGTCKEVNANPVKFNYHYYVIYELLKQVKDILNINVEVRK